MCMSPPLTLSSLPLFPLGTVLYPDGRLPLRIFEVRYLDMVQKCHRAGAPFGVVSLLQGQEVRQPGHTESFVTIGTLAAIEHCHTVQAGLMEVQAKGAQRFRIIRFDRLPHGLWIADVEQVASDPKVNIPTDLQVIALALHKIYNNLRHRQAESQVPAEEDCQWQDCAWVANRWCELLPLPLTLKQQLLELDNPLVRLELVGDFLGRAGIT